ncbi:MAG: HEAT-repeat-containing PBS lyase [Elusimicrobia bacterium]|nr:MAG: HEAT-repeat-containing PBS lyase [Elusimicrobiota bacterium]
MKQQADPAAEPRVFTRARYYSAAAFALAFWATGVAQALEPEALAAAIADLWLNDPARRSAATQVLLRMGAPAVAPVLREARTERRERIAARLIAQMGDDGVAALVAALGDPESDLRAGSILFTVITPESARRIPELLECVARMPRVNHYCGTALVKIADARAGKHWSLLAERLGHPDADVRMYAAAALGRLGKSAKGAGKALTAALRDPEPRVRAAAAGSLGDVGSRTVETLEGLRGAKRDENAEVRRRAEAALRELRG